MLNLLTHIKVLKILKFQVHGLQSAHLRLPLNKVNIETLIISLKFLFPGQCQPSFGTTAAN